MKTLELKFYCTATPLIFRIIFHHHRHLYRAEWRAFLFSVENRKYNYLLSLDWDVALFMLCFHHSLCKQISRHKLNLWRESSHKNKTAISNTNRPVYVIRYLVNCSLEIHIKQTVVILMYSAFHVPGFEKSKSSITWLNVQSRLIARVSGTNLMLFWPCIVVNMWK